MKQNNVKNQSIKELFENRLVEMAVNSSNKKKSVKKIINTLEVYDLLNNELEA